MGQTFRDQAKKLQDEGSLGRIQWLYFSLEALEGGFIESREGGGCHSKLLVGDTVVLLQGMLGGGQLVAMVTPVHHVHVLRVHVLVHHLLPVVHVATLAARIGFLVGEKLDLVPDPLVRCLLLLWAFHNH